MTENGERSLRQALLEVGLSATAARTDLDDIARRAKKVRSRRHVATIAAALLVVSVGVAGPLVVLSSLSGPAPREAGTSPSVGPTESPNLTVPPPESNATLFVPQTTRQDGEVVMPITFTDGTRMVLSYPTDLGLEELGVTPTTTVCGRTLSVAHGSAAGTFTGDSAPREVYEDAYGQPIGYWRGKTSRAEWYLIFQFGDWTVAVPDQDEYRMRPERVATCASGLRGEETEDGFLLLHADPSLNPTLAGHTGPTIVIGDDQGLLIYKQSCASRQMERLPGFVEWCVPDASAMVQAFGSEQFLDAVSSGLRID
jgi:hypothetical protein